VTCHSHPYTLLQISISRKHSPQKPVLALPLRDTRRIFHFFWIPFVLSASWFGVSCWMPLLLFLFIYFFKSLPLTHSPSTNSAFSLRIYIYPPAETLHPHVSGRCSGQQRPLLQLSDFKQAARLLPTFIPGRAAAVPSRDTIARRHGENAHDAPPDPLGVSQSIPAHPRQGWQVPPKTDVGEGYHGLW